MMACDVFIPPAFEGEPETAAPFLKKGCCRQLEDTVGQKIPATSRDRSKARFDQPGIFSALFALHRVVLPTNLDGLTRNPDGLTRNLDGLTTNLDSLARNLDSLTRNLDGLTRNLDDLTRNPGGLTRNLDDATRNLDGLTRNLDDATRNLDGLTTHLDGFPPCFGMRRRWRMPSSMDVHRCMCYLQLLILILV